MLENLSEGKMDIAKQLFDITEDLDAIRSWTEMKIVEQKTGLDHYSEA